MITNHNLCQNVPKCHYLWVMAMLRFTCEGFLFTCDGVTVEVWRCCRCQCSRLRYIQLFKIILLAVWTSSEVIVAITAIKSSILAWRQLTTSSQNIISLLNRLKDWKRQPMHHPYSSTELSSKTSINLTKQRHRLHSESIKFTHHLQKKHVWYSREVSIQKHVS